MKGGLVFDGQKRAYIALETASVPLTDIGFQRSAGVFETFLAYNNQPFYLNEHLKRLHLSARLLGIKEHFLSSYIEEKIKFGLKKLKKPLVLVKIIVTGGDASYLSFESDPRLYIIFTPFTRPNKKYYEKGVSLLTTSLLRTFPSVKSLNYLEAVVSYENARKKKYYDSIYTTKSHVMEGTTFNFGIIIKNNLIVPQSNVFDGITMNVVLKLAKKIGLNVFRKPITFKELKRADEAIIASSSREVMPVTKIDEMKIGSGLPGKYAKKLLAEYQLMTAKGSN